MSRDIDALSPLRTVSHNYINHERWGTSPTLAEPKCEYWNYRIASATP